MNLPDYQPSFRPPLQEAKLVRAYLDKLYTNMRRALNQGVQPQALVYHYTKNIDVILRHLYRRLVINPDISIIAVGGYGRKELFPRSDIDLLILHPEHLKQSDLEHIEELIHIYWLLGLDIAHSVRSIEDCYHIAGEDLSALTALLEMRYIAGNAELLRCFDMHRAKSLSALDFLYAKQAEQAHRDQSHQQVGALEPNIKTAPGGLRDIHMIHWLCFYIFDDYHIRPLTRLEILTHNEYMQLMESKSYLWHVRLFLHLNNPRKEDRLLFDQQAHLAEHFQLHDTPQASAIEQFMLSYYRASQTVRYLNNMICKALEARLAPGETGRELDRCYHINNRQLSLKPLISYYYEPHALFKAFIHLQNNEDIQSIHPDTVRRMHRETPILIDERFRADPMQQSMFRAILGHPGKVAQQLRRMHEHGILAAYIPDFAHSIGRMQYDLFHQYTVDQHSLLLLEFLDRFKEDAQTFPLAHHIMQKIEDRSLLYLAGLYHDLGKGYGGDHSAIGSERLRAYASSHGYRESEQELLAFLVAHHLDLSATTQRRDLSDPQVIINFAELFPDHAYLDYLYLLTVADINATNAKLWNSWRADLIDYLYHQTAAYLLGNDNSRQSIARVKFHALKRLERKERQAAYLLWQKLPETFFINESANALAKKTLHLLQLQPKTETRISLVCDHLQCLFISSPYQASLIFLHTAQFLEHNCFDIREARLYRLENGLNIQEYTLNDNPLISEMLPRLHALLNPPSTDIPPLPELRDPHQLRHFSTAIDIAIYPDHDGKRSILEIRCQDQRSLLSKISRILYRHGLHVHHAKISTYGERVEDIFYLSNAANQALQDTKAIEQLKNDLFDRID